MDMKTTRTYTMTARAAAAEDTRRRIIDAAIALAGERPFVDITLEAVAERAEVSVKTVLRQFGSRDGLLAARWTPRWPTPRTSVGPGRGPRGRGPHRRRPLREPWPHRAPDARPGGPRRTWPGQPTDRGKAMHRDWVRDAFAPATEDEALLDLLVVATDVYTWKLLRLDRGHSRAVTEQRMHGLVQAAH